MALYYKSAHPLKSKTVLLQYNCTLVLAAQHISSHRRTAKCSYILAYQRMSHSKNHITSDTAIEDDLSSPTQASVPIIWKRLSRILVGVPFICQRISGRIVPPV
jgi:hypothetical protein